MHFINKMEEFVPFDRLSTVLNYIVVLSSLVFLLIIVVTEKKDIIFGFKGKDKVWQFLEFSGIVWLVLFPAAIASSLLGQQVDPVLLAALDVIYIVNIGGKAYHKKLENDKQENDNKSNSTEYRKESKVVTTGSNPSNIE